MTFVDIAVIAVAVLMAAFTLWALWPRFGLRAGRRNNWRQRNVDEIQSGKTDAAADFDSPYLIAMDFSRD